ncbi:hypothetical protein BJ322DRAFT_1211430 [Thelephora terrestris]|uniref:NACHT domain-containing protein n=1 Tax=Thelephora terrestris TaxID=56493 RepID=A0A9P6HCY9_9AGAM|nr:hypothetical protein BJ322DRAFT_1211430 [Thelephora terrestris]
MSFFKKFKKSRPPSQSPTPGVPSKIGHVVPPEIGPELVPDISSEGGNDGGGSQVALQDSKDGRSHPSGPSTSTAGYGHGVAVAAIHERESEQEDPFNVLDEQISHDVRSGTYEVPTKEAALGFSSLKEVMGAVSHVYAHRQEIIHIGNKAKGLISRVDALENLFNSRPSDAAERRHRDEVILKLKGIEERLRLLCQKPGLQQPTDNIQDHGNLAKSLEELRKTIFDYQMERQKKIYDHECKLMNRDEARVLNGFCCAQGAEFRHGDRDGCLTGTRVAVLDGIELWTRDFTEPTVYWLNGLAGTGKTTITQTVAERTFADGQLGASFFCSRDFVDRSNLRSIFPTLAVQLARKHPKFRSLFVNLVESDPGISHESLYDQMRKMIVQPLKESNISTVVIIDALDECTDEEPASAILSVLGQFVAEIPKVKFLVTGRPEPRILEGFRFPLLAEATDVFVLHEVETSQVAEDIRLFFRHKFSDLVRRRRGLDDWPTKEQLDLLCERAAGLFVYAVATVKFIDKQSVNPRKQLDLLLQSPESSAREAKTKLKKNTTLDSLYASILRGAFGDDGDPDNDPKVCSVLGAMILAANPLSPSAIAMLLGLEVLDDVLPILSSAQSLLIFHEDINSPVRPFHKSFPDFIIDLDRCTDKRFHISPPAHHSELLIGCLDLMNQTLEKNMCRLPDAVANSDVSDLKERVEQSINPGLQYACKLWHTHLSGPAMLINTPKITAALHQFLETKFLFWLEVLSVVGAARNAIDALQAVADQLKESPTLDLVNDLACFVTLHFDVIVASSPHIYHSALVLSPKTSVIRKLYESYAQPLIQVVHGLPTSWGSHTAATSLPFPTQSAVWSPCSRFIAISASNTIRVDILDPETLQRLQSLEYSQEIAAFPLEHTFSPDVQMLTCLACTSRYHFGSYMVLIVTWDLQTGGVASAIRRQIRPISNKGIAYSTNGKMVGILHLSDEGAIISIYDIVSGVYMHDTYCSTTCPEYIWSHGGAIHVATATSTTVMIQEVGFAPDATCVEVKTLSIPARITHINQAQFLFTSNQLTIIYKGDMPGVLVWSLQDSKCLLYHEGIDFILPMTFSSNGQFSACSTSGTEVYVWRESPTGYTFYTKLSAITEQPMVLLSPNGKSIIGVCDSSIQLWHTKSFITTPSAIPTQVDEHIRDFLLCFHAERPLAVVMRQGENTVTVLDLESGLPQLTIETSMEVYGLRVIGDTIVIIGGGKVITWNLLEGKFSPDGEITVNDSDLIMNLFGYLGGKIIATSISLDLRYIAILRTGDFDFVRVYDAAAGKPCVNSYVVNGGQPLWFTPGRPDICCTLPGKGAEVVTINQNRLLKSPIEVSMADLEDISWGCPWKKSGGYQVTDDGWIVGGNKKRLLMLPPPWQPHMENRVWNRKFLALLHGSIPEPVILKLEP